MEYNPLKFKKLWLCVNRFGYQAQAAQEKNWAMGFPWYFGATYDFLNLWKYHRAFRESLILTKLIYVVLASGSFSVA